MNSFERACAVWVVAGMTSYRGATETARLVTTVARDVSSSAQERASTRCLAGTKRARPNATSAGEFEVRPSRER